MAAILKVWTHTLYYYEWHIKDAVIRCNEACLFTRFKKSFILINKALIF